MLVELLRELAHGHDALEVLAVPVDVALREAIARTSADVVILDPGAHTTATVTAAMRQYPLLRTIALVDHGSRALTVELRPHTERFVDVSPQTLLRVINAPAAWTAPAGDAPLWQS